jgi:hypothetical protein
MSLVEVAEAFRNLLFKSYMRLLRGNGKNTHFDLTNI